MSSRFHRAAVLAASVLAGAAHAQVAYISSSSGHVLHMSGSTAVIARWSGQAPIQGFGGYGVIQMSGRCLTGRTGTQPLTWEGCNASDKAQRWALGGGKLNNELGWCADVEGERGAPDTRVLAWKCTGRGNQQWRSHRVESAQVAASRIGNAQVRATFLQTAQSAQPGAIISTATGRLVAAGGGNLVAAGGGNLVAAGGGNLVAAGGGN